MIFKKVLNFIKINKNHILLSLLALLEIFDLFCLSLFANNKFTMYSESLLLKLQFNSLHFRSAIYDDMLNMTTYIISFVAGGALAFIVIKLTGKIAKGTGLVNYESLSLLPVALLIITFLLGCFLSGFSPRWLNPFLTYIGGVFLYFLSCVRLKVNY